MSRTLVRSSGSEPPPELPELPRFGGGGGDDGSGRSGPGNDRKISLTGIVVLMCASIMTFSAFLSAMVIRRGLGTHWGRTPLPPLLYVNTAVLLLSSVVLDVARRLMHRGKRQAFNWTWTLGTLLGTMFLGGQFFAWEQLAKAGIYATTSPSSSFFYVFTWAHAFHAVCALIALYYIEYRALRFQLGPARRTMMIAVTVFWHFLDVLWLGIMALFRYWG